ncbi:transglutaminase family protein [Hansschlegelia zhihuaiae]|uniref:Transglutaminase family protein n=1 Tax=Hansschlegelia zhihuaiae TaxID=405005 RepID=A0A4Q0MJT0_9HYPH|nr:transglutaminase family protein [Hansschlegelia zhihuaiae]RXF73840.1 transglutaminase family protein [Hansschlegelia zhihuaiae]
MRLKIRHETIYTFETPASAVIQTLRVTPRGHEGQHVVHWRLDVDHNCRLRQSEDAFGNYTHVFASEGHIERLTVLVEGEVDTQDTGGVVRGAVERFPPALYLRETDLTAPDLDIAAFALEAEAAGKGDRLGTLHALLSGVHERMTFEAGPTDSATTAAQAFGMKRGVCQDLTHVFLAASRRLNIPARYVGGYVRREPAALDGAGMTQSIDADGMRQSLAGPTEESAGHAWAEAFVPDLGWVGFDPANCVCATEAHVRVAIGLDYLSAAPVRGTRYGGGGETLEVNVSVEDARAKRAFRRA